MKINERDWIVGNYKIGTQLFYSDVEPELKATEKGTRVLPACFFYEKNIHCELIKRYEPGEYNLMPDGGFEVWCENGGRRYFNLDQVIIHPNIIKQNKRLEKMKLKAEKALEKRHKQFERAQRKVNKHKNKVPKEDNLIAQASIPKGKRGRPKSNVAPKVYIPTGNKRGRPKSK